MTLWAYQKSVPSSTALRLMKLRTSVRKAIIVSGRATDHLAVLFVCLLAAVATILRSLTVVDRFSNFDQTRILKSDTVGTARIDQINGSTDHGVHSSKESSFFHALQAEIDNADDVERCNRYNFTYNRTHHPAQRRIFYGTLIADETWELLNIVAAESNGIYAGMVFVESNRTQNGTPRPFTKLPHQQRLADLFGVVPTSNVQVRAFVDDPKSNNQAYLATDDPLQREHAQREEILEGWRELGMSPNDVGLLADVDETFTRDFLRAVQVCDGLDAFDYNQHQCRHEKVKLTAVSRVFESSPECITGKRSWHHPDMLIGRCIEGIGDAEKHPPVARENGSFPRPTGFGSSCHDWEGEGNISNGSFPLWSASDFRKTCGGRMYPLVKNLHANKSNKLDRFTGYHFHNFVSHFNATRWKYKTFGHPDSSVDSKSLEDMNSDLQLMYRCVKDLPHNRHLKRKRVEGGFAKIKPFLPIYFQDDDYRRRRHSHVVNMVEADEKYVLAMRKLKQIARNRTTDTGVNVDDPDIYGSTPGLIQGDSSTATVIALATNYDLETYTVFVESLRQSGYKGHVILGVHNEVTDEILKYLHSRNVVTKLLSWVNCTYTKHPDDHKDIFKLSTCAYPYPDIKIRWSRYPLARDWLIDCKTCTGPVLFTDARDTVFQRDPFGPGSPVVQGLQVFQEHVDMTTQNWLTHWPIKSCKGVEYDAPMLCSGTTIGTRAAMLRYLEIVYEEMKVWISQSNCRFDINGDDQSIHNYLFYSGQLPFASSIANRAGGIVNTVGYQAGQIAKLERAKAEQDMTGDATRKIAFKGADESTWIDPNYGITNERGLFTDLDGSVSRVVHQWDRFGIMYQEWLHKQPFVQAVHG